MIHFDKFDLNTYRHTPYFEAHLPDDYPISKVLQAAGAFRFLPPNLRRLAEAGRQWARPRDFFDPAIDSFYDDEGFELDPGNGRLTHQQISSAWGRKIPAADLPDLPATELADPDQWEPDEMVEESTDVPSLRQLELDIQSRGVAATAEEYGAGGGLGSGLDASDAAQAIRAVLLSQRRR